jgi:hypothetical protein
MSRTRPSDVDKQDDSIDIAGWVFADLLLSLAIIFLVSISFSVPDRAGLGSSPDKQTSGQNEFKRADLGEQAPINLGFNLYYSEFDVNQIQSDLKRYFEKENLDPATEVIFAQVVGGFDAISEGSERGTFRALEFSIALKKAEISAFAKANYDLTTSSQLDPNQVALRLSFVPPLKTTE